MLFIIVSLVIILGAIGAFTFYIANKYGKEDNHHHA
jgi:hypothetical protein